MLTISVPPPCPNCAPCSTDAPPAASTAAAEAKATSAPAEKAQTNVANPGDSEIETNWDQVIDNFDAMDLKPDLLRGIYAVRLSLTRHQLRESVGLTLGN